MVRLRLKSSFIKISFTWIWDLQVELWALSYGHRLRVSPIAFSILILSCSFDQIFNPTKFSCLKSLEKNQNIIIQIHTMNDTKENTSTTQSKNTNKTKYLSYLPQNPWNYESKEDKSNILASFFPHGSDMDGGGETLLDVKSSNW